MKTIEIEMGSDDSALAIKDNILFISGETLNVDIRGKYLIIEINDNINKKNLIEAIKKFENRYINLPKELLFKSEKEKKQFYKFNEDNSFFDTIYFNDDGYIGFKGLGLKLFRILDSCFAKIAEKYGAQERIYPVLLPVKEYEKTGYLKRTPQYAIFCSEITENINLLEQVSKKVKVGDVLDLLEEPNYALSPSACFHTYLEMKNKKLEKEVCITFLQNVFRNEGHGRFSEFGRMRDYHVREVVFIGTWEYCDWIRMNLLRDVAYLLNELGLQAEISTASDHFILPKMRKFEKIQRNERTKYEILLNYTESRKIAVASFNLHGTAFSSPFNISVENVEKTVTGCVGFGIERWVLAFLSQYGDNYSKWPNMIRERL